MNTRVTLLSMVAAVAIAAPAHAQSPSPAPPNAPSPPETQIAYPPERPIDRTPHRVVVPGPSNRARSSVGGEELTGWHAVSLSEGKGRVSIGGTPHDLARGSTVGGYTVRSVAPGRVVLERAAPARPGQPAGGTELAILTFAGGSTRVVRLFDTDPTPVPRLAP